MAMLKYEPGLKIGAWYCVGVEWRQTKHGAITEPALHIKLKCACGKVVEKEDADWPEYRAEFELQNLMDCGCGGYERMLADEKAREEEEKQRKEEEKRLARQRREEERERERKRKEEEKRKHDQERLSQRFMGRPYLTADKRRQLIHWNLAPDVITFVGELAQRKQIPISRAAEEVLRAGMEAIEVPVSRPRAVRPGFSDVEREYA